MNSELKNSWLKNTSACRGRETEWLKIEEVYSAPGRYYHSLAHLSHLYLELSVFYGENIPAATVFALFYHDYVYSLMRTDNEKQSAAYAASKLEAWDIKPAIIQKACDMILATANHEGNDEETMVFLDADMAILGTDPTEYAAYTAKVRKEFNIYPDLLYHKGRRKFIETTLKRGHIFLTTFFREKYEVQARINLTHELRSLS